MEMCQPSATVLQHGADSLSGDRLGCFNLTLNGHGKCVEFIKKWNLPVLLLGGGGYTIRNVARCWTYEISIALNCDVANELSYNDYFEYYGPDFKLHISPSNMGNQNTPGYMDTVKTCLFENLRMFPYAPGVQMQAIPEDALNDESDDEDKANPDQRISIRQTDKRIACEEEFSKSEDEDGGRKDRREYKKKRQKIDGDDKNDAENEAKKDEKDVKREAADVKDDFKVGSEKLLFPQPPHLRQPLKEMRLRPSRIGMQTPRLQQAPA